MKTTEALLEQIAETYKRQPLSGQPGSLKTLREAAFERLQDIPFPTTKHEEWKYTRVAPLLSRKYEALEQSKPFAAEVPISSGNFYRLVFTNGAYNAAASDLPAAKVTVSSLQSALQTHPDLVEQHLGKYAPHTTDAFSAWSAAVAAEGYFVHLRKGAVLDKPLLLVHQLTAAADSLHMPRNLVVAEENAQAQLAELVQVEGEAHVLENAVTEIVVGQSAHLTHLRLQNYPEGYSQISTIAVQMAQKAVYSNVVLTFGGEIVRNNLNIKIIGERAEANMYGLYQLNNRSHCDNHTSVDHTVPNTESNQLYKGLLDGNSSGVFNGKIFVREDAQKTNAFQSNKNLMLSEKASVDTKPQLEIWADDVKCSHGATIGRLDEEPLFYLRARGIPEKQARALLLTAFAAEVANFIPNPELKEFALQIVQEDLGTHL